MPSEATFYSVEALAQAKRSYEELVAVRSTRANLAVQLEDLAKSMENRNRHVGTLPSVRKAG